MRSEYVDTSVVHKKGFTLLELLVAMTLLVIVMLALLRGTILYIRYSYNQQLKEQAGLVFREWADRIKALAYYNPTISPSSYNGSWGSATCDITGSCTFMENDIDGDGIRDFFDPYNGNNSDFFSNPTNTANWVSYQGNMTYKGTTIHTALTFARLVRFGTETGKAIGITVWYFEPSTRSYKSVSGFVIKERP